MDKHPPNPEPPSREEARADSRQLGHSVAICADTYLHVMDELEDTPRISAEDAIQAARHGNVAQWLPKRTDA